MTKRSREAQRVNRLVSKYARKFGLLGANGYELTINLLDEPDVTTAEGPGPAGVKLAGSCDAEPAYKRALLEFDRSTVKGYNNEELEGLVAHEMLHVVLAPLYQWTSDMLETTPRANRRRLWKAYSQINEGVTTHLERIVLSE